MSLHKMKISGAFQAALDESVRDMKDSVSVVRDEEGIKLASR